MGVTPQSSPIAIGTVGGGVNIYVVALDGFDEHGDGVTIITPVVSTIGHVERGFGEMAIVTKFDGFCGHDEKTVWTVCVGAEGDIVTGCIEGVINLR